MGARKRRADKQKKLKEKKKTIKAEELKKAGKDPKQLYQPPSLKKGKGRGKGKGKWKAVPKAGADKKPEVVDDDVEVEWSVPDVLEGTEMENAIGFAAVRDRFKHVEP